MPPRKSQRRQQILEAFGADAGGQSRQSGLPLPDWPTGRGFRSGSLPPLSQQVENVRGLIEFIEETLFSRIAIILGEEATAARRCEKMLMLLLAFTERNPGITRILTGDALAGETERLHQRVAQLFDRFETQLQAGDARGGNAGGAAPDYSACPRRPTC